MTCALRETARVPATLRGVRRCVTCLDTAGGAA